MSDADQAEPTFDASSASGRAHGQVDRRGLLAYTYLHGTQSLETACERLGGPEGLLRSASQSLAASVAYDVGESSPQSSDDEIRELGRFAREAGLLMDADKIRAFVSENAMIGGSEPKVAEGVGSGRVRCA